MVSAPPPITMAWREGERGDLIWKFAKILWWQNFFLHLWQDKPLWVELKTNGGVIFITTLLHFHYFTSLETVNTLRSKVFLLRISLGNVNASVVTCRYPQIYNYSFRKGYLETICKCIFLRCWPQVLLQHPWWRTVLLAVSALCGILVNNT